MDDLISRQAAIDAVNRLSLGETDAVRLSMRIADYLNRMPSAQPKRGKWINDRCSVCGYKVMPWNNTPYCHRCGADMRGEQE